VAWGPEFADKYDQIILDENARKYFGSSGFYNAGYWGTGSTTQDDACIALTDRMIDTFPATLTSIADIGCGLGATTLRLTERHPEAHVTAINFSAAQLLEVGKRCPTATLVHGDAVRTGLPADSFDAILSVEAALHFHTRERFFVEAFRLLRPGGQLAMTDILFAPGGWPGSWTVPEDNFVESLDTYRAQMTAAGFVAIEIEDPLAETWGGFCDGWERWGVQLGLGGKAAEAMARNIAGMRAGTRHYPLISAHKPR
jgi:MPBQ/MSBQ methyltransferase